MNSSQRFFRYLPRNPNEVDWGSSVLDAGHGTIMPNSEYSLPGHPEGHEFSWEKGRRLGAFTFVYITAGKGFYDSDLSGQVDVEAGSVFVVFPNIWHRYRPNPETGWEEYWVECEGELLEAAVLRAGLHPTSPVMRVGHDDHLLRCFLNIADTISEDAPGFEAIVAMRSLEIVARIRSLMKISCTRGVTSPQKLVKHAQVKMREALDGPIDFHQLAQHLGISYTTFRRVFKQETGRPPGEYFIEMKINRAKELLLTDRSIQEVADLLGFESVYYFSRLFKARTGSSPSALRPDPSQHRRH